MLRRLFSHSAICIFAVAILCCTAFICAPSSAKAASFAQGSGTLQDPYVITDAASLALISDFTGDSYASTYFVLGANIDLSNYLSGNDQGWLPIGTRASAFQARFDGNGYSVSGLRINRPEDNYCGLFGYVGSMAKISNLTVIVDNTSAYGGIHSDSNAGAIAGSSSGEITNCFAYASDSSREAVFATSSAGGITGYLGGTSAKILRSGSDLSISVSGSNAGAISGVVAYGALISQSWSNSDSVSAHSRAGGIAGWLYASGIDNSSSFTSVFASNGRAGGLAGHLQESSYITNSYSASFVFASDFASGAVAGELSDDSSLSNAYYYNDFNPALPQTGLGYSNPSHALSIANGGVTTLSSYSGFSSALWALLDDSTLPYLTYNPVSGLSYDLSYPVSLFASLPDTSPVEIPSDGLIYALDNASSDLRLNASAGKVRLLSNGYAITVRGSLANIFFIQTLKLPSVCDLNFELLNSELLFNLNYPYPYPNAQMRYSSSDGVQHLVAFNSGEITVSADNLPLSLHEITVTDTFGNLAVVNLPNYINDDSTFLIYAPDVVAPPELTLSQHQNPDTQDEESEPHDDSALDTSLDDTYDALGHWAYDAIDFVVTQNLMDNTGINSFAPDAAMTRSELILTLYRFDAMPDVSALECPFTDVSPQSAYYDAIRWALDTGIIQLSDDLLFSPETFVTREYIADTLYNYGMFKTAGSLTDGTLDDNALDIFTDSENASDYAVNALRWSVTNGLIVGRGNDNLAPADIATRAEAATIIFRLAYSNALG